jgi:hypothetical protein
VDTYAFPSWVPPGGVGIFLVYYIPFRARLSISQPVYRTPQGTATVANPWQLSLGLFSPTIKGHRGSRKDLLANQGRRGVLRYYADPQYAGTHPSRPSSARWKGVKSCNMREAVLPSNLFWRFQLIPPTGANRLEQKRSTDPGFCSRP